MAELTATYRLQMNAGFTLADARARVNYFARLGVSHLYLSPIFAARRGSMHGYDVVDPCRVNPGLGSEADLVALSDALRGHRMGIILDIVPNHMGIGPENDRWDDVLERGERSRFARWFDIDWHRAGPDQGKVLLPVLGDELDRVLERGELSVRVSAGRPPRVRYFQQSFPLDASTIPPELQLATVDPEETGELADLFSGSEGRDRLRALLDIQHYRLLDWRSGAARINYRRFFDVNDLAAVRVEDEQVFHESHALVLDLVRRGIVDGLRVDHVDGLRDPLAYLRRLRDALPPGVPVFVEKILTGDETLRPSWPVEGTTGYEFLNDLEDVFISPSGFATIESGYRRMRRLPAEQTFREIARAGKTAVLRGPLQADVARLAASFVPVARPSGRKAKASELAPALVELIASLPVYRTYLDSRLSVDDEDRALIESARSDAIAHAPALRPVIDAVCDVLLDTADGVDESLRMECVARFQQVSGPAAAKGVEDTALYRYVPLVSRNEVGGAPDRSLSDAVSRLHESNGRRARHWPGTLLAVNTHDTKRSADVRARIDALSELSADWDRALRRWRRLNARHRATVRGRIAPDTNTEYLVYQTLVALWPPPRAGRRVDDLPDRSWREAARERLIRYALKAAREAKTSTSWVDPDGRYEEALRAFVGAILEPADDAPFLSDVARLVARAAPIGAASSLSRIAIHLTSPGIPDIYQGDELWNFTLVDPDNRAPVDYAMRGDLLDRSGPISPDPTDHRVKLLLTSRLLQERRSRAELFREGRYVPLKVTGARAEHLVAFARITDTDGVVTLAARLSCDLVGKDAAGWWSDTRVELPEPLHGRAWRSVFDGEMTTANGNLEPGSLLRTIPVAVLFFT